METLYIDRTPVEVTLRNGRANTGTVVYTTTSGGGTGGGASGYSGYSGIDGLSGYSGIGLSGYSGLNGDAALSGYSGIDGLSGYSGASTSGYSGYSGQDGAGVSGYYGSFISLTDQLRTGLFTNTGEEIVTFDNTVEANGISLANNSQIVFANPNTYCINATLNFNKKDVMQYWLKKNGTAVENTSFFSKQTSSLSLPNIYYNTSEAQWIVTTTNPNDYFEIAFGVTTTMSDTIGLIYTTGDTRPDLPSARFDVHQVMFLAASVSGASGYSGASTSGYSGYSGESNISGYSGYSGDSTSGYSGYSGNGGLSGYSGVDGFSGADGASGYSGTNGTNGTNGASGYSGINGTSGYSGSSPSGITDPDFYYDTATDTLHTPNEAISGVLTYIDGNQASGYVLTSDANGVAHWTAGGAGTSGYSGYSGNGGLSGYSGVDGTSGTNGTNGSDGASGYSGYSGYGESGYSGYSGENGKPGDIGEQGLSGYSGQSNVSGYSGYSGRTGADGLSGYSGIGVSGYSGSQGLSGYSGATGAAGGVTYVGLSAPSIFNVSGTPVTSSGTLGLNLNTQAERTFFAGDTLGNGNAVPAFRTIVASDLPTLPYDNYVAWKFTAGGTDVPINSTGSTATYRGVEFVEGDGITFGLASNINNQVRLTISSYGISGAGASGFSGYSGKSGYSGSNGSAGTSGYSGATGGSASSGYSGYSGFSGYSGYSPNITYTSSEQSTSSSGTFFTSPTLAANSIYQVNLTVRVKSASASVGIFLNLEAYENTATITADWEAPLTNNTYLRFNGTGAAGSPMNLECTATPIYYGLAFLRNTVLTGAAPVDLTFTFETETAGTTVYVGQGSMMEVIKIA